MGKTSISWATDTWSPVTGCTPVSEACAHCYAKRMAYRLRGRYGYPEDEPFRVTLHPERLEDPARWKKPRRVFVCSMGDLFHEDVPSEFIKQVMGAMVAAPQHSYLVLTKRHQRLYRFFRDQWPELHDHPSIWVGVTVENQARAMERIPYLMHVPASVLFVSAEPMLGPLDLRAHHGRVGDSSRDVPQESVGAPRALWACRVCDGTGQVKASCGDETAWAPCIDCHGSGVGLGLVICGGETCHGARPMNPAWVCDLRDQCVAAGVSFHFKAWGEYVGGHPTELLDGRPGWCLFHNGDFSPSWGHLWDAQNVSMKVGKKDSGRKLDGRTWDEMPEREDG